MKNPRSYIYLNNYNSLLTLMQPLGNKFGFQINKNSTGKLSRPFFAFFSIYQGKFHLLHSSKRD